MKRLLLALLALSALSACGKPAEQGDVPRLKSGATDWTIPAVFQGEWHADLSKCGDAADATRLVITADHLSYRTAEGEVKASKAAPDGITLIGEFHGKDLDGVDTVWQRAYVFNITPDGKTLTSVEEGPAAERHRCEKKP